MSKLCANIVHDRVVPGKTGTAAILLVLALTAPSPAQEAIRMSQASEEAAQARREAAAMLSYYNIHWGPSLWRFSSSLGLEGRDNASLTEKNPEADMLIKPQVNTRFWLPISEKNSLNLSLGVGYMKYLRSSDAGKIFIPPGTELSFDLYVGDSVINFHDRATVWSDAYENPTLSETRFYQRLENIAGITANWDLNRLKLVFGYDHGNYVSLNSTLSQSDGQLETFFARGGYVVARTTTAGLEAGVNLINYSDSAFKDALQYNAGPYWEGRLTEHLRFKVSAGYTIYSPYGDGELGVTDDTGAVYGQISVSHRINHLLTYSLSGGRTIQSGMQWGIAGRNLDLSSVRWAGDWNLVHKIRITTPLFFEHGEETGTFEDNFNRFGGGINVGRYLTKNFYGSLGYLFSRRSSDQPGRSYDLNIVSLNLTYTF